MKLDSDIEKAGHASARLEWKWFGIRELETETTGEPWGLWLAGTAFHLDAPDDSTTLEIVRCRDADSAIEFQEHKISCPSVLVVGHALGGMD